jgi:hypothetical protein
MHDSAKGLGIGPNVQRIVCKSAWGIMTHNAANKEEPFTWALAHDQLTFSQPPQLNIPPQTAGSTEEPLPTTVMAYADFIDKICPKIEDDEARNGERA